MLGLFLNSVLGRSITSQDTLNNIFSPNLFLSYPPK